MVFSSPIFLFLFLPMTLAGYFVLPSRARNLWLVLTSLVFYGWGEPKFLVVMLISVAVNFQLALWVDRFRGRLAARVALASAVVVNIGLLVVYKYLSFLAEALNAILPVLRLPTVTVPAIALPIGISFFTFQALSYVIDVHRRDAPVQRNPLHVGLYISLFPQLIAGPIVRYRDVAMQIAERSVTQASFARGVERFVVGLGKKVLIANTLASPADLIFSIPGDQLTTGVAWLGVLCYALQIYFDFSGYSDMAIGLGLMVGFRFLENFDYPYISRSLTEFWRRWHISLSTWFRDYLYIPLGGNRRSLGRVYLNLVSVFFLCGLWHGASWNFVIWGLLHGSVLVGERVGLARWVARLWTPLRLVYVLLVVMVGWVFFRAATLPDAWAYLNAMAGLSAAAGIEHTVALYLDPEKLVAIGVGVLGSTPLLGVVQRWRARITRPAADLALGMAQVVALATILVASAMSLAAGTYNPFIYFRF